MALLLKDRGGLPGSALRLYKLPVAAQQAQEVLLQDVGYDWGALKLCRAAQSVIHHLQLLHYCCATCKPSA